jgi:Transcriptional regulator
MPRRDDAHMKTRRKEIIDAATRCFLREGLAATSISDIRKESGLSTGAIYLHFTNKAEIVAAVAEERKRELSLDPSLNDGNGLSAWAERRLKALTSPARGGHIGFDLEALAHPERSDGVAAMIGDTMLAEQNAIAEAIGGDANARAYAVLMQSFLNGAGLLARAGATHEEDLRAALHLLLHQAGIAGDATE